MNLTRRLIRYDISNPPKNDRECAGYLKSVLEEDSINRKLITVHPDRPTLIVRLPGQGNASPLPLQVHMNVVPAASDD